MARVSKTIVAGSLMIVSGIIGGFASSFGTDLYNATKTWVLSNHFPLTIPQLMFLVLGFLGIITLAFTRNQKSSNLPASSAVQEPPQSQAEQEQPEFDISFADTADRQAITEYLTSRFPAPHLASQYLEDKYGRGFTREHLEILQVLISRNISTPRQIGIFLNWEPQRTISNLGWLQQKGVILINPRRLQSSSD